MIIWMHFDEVVILKIMRGGPGCNARLAAADEDTMLHGLNAEWG